MSKPSQTGTAQVPSAVQNDGMRLYLSRRMAIALVVALTAPWGGMVLLFLGLGVLNLFDDAGVAGSNILGARVMRGKPGPWGHLQYTRIAIEPPERFIVLSKQPQAPRWFFKGVKREQLTSVLQTLPFTDIQRVSFTQSATWTETNEGVWLAPPAELVLALTPDVRAQLYGLLMLVSENQMQAKLHTFNSDFLDERIGASGLATESVELFRKLLYRRGQQLLFADEDVVLPRLPNDAERLRFLKMLDRENALLVKLLITPETDVDKLVSYWGVGGRAKDLEPLLRSLRRVSGGTELGIAQLLPSFARRRLYTYAQPKTKRESASMSDLWAVLNFFNWTPDSRYSDIMLAGETIRKEYYEIAGDGRLGDMVALFTADNKMVSAAVYIADDIIFTRSSPRPTSPWLLTTISYWANQWAPFFPQETPPSVRTCRRK
ncbi:MAG: hypothetical protein WCV00_06710 [Verrucomicrobiia bacterium]